MTIEVLDMPDVTDLIADAAIFQRRQRVAIELAHGTTGHPVLPPTAPCAWARVRDMRFLRKRDGNA